MRQAADSASTAGGSSVRLHPSCALIEVRGAGASASREGPARMTLCGEDLPGPSWPHPGHGTTEGRLLDARLWSRGGGGCRRRTPFRGCSSSTRRRAASGRQSARRTSESGRPGRGGRCWTRCGASPAGCTRSGSGAARRSRSSATTARASTGRWTPPRPWGRSRSRSTRTRWPRRWPSSSPTPRCASRSSRTRSRSTSSWR